MGKILFVKVLVAFCAVFRADALQCYVCRDCQKVDSSYVQTCPRPRPVTTTAVPDDTVVSICSRANRYTTDTTTDSTIDTTLPTSTTTTEPSTTTAAAASASPEESYHGNRSELQFSDAVVKASRNQHVVLCVVWVEPSCLEAIYDDNGVTNFIRDCYYAPEETEESTDPCRNIVGSNGTIVKCKICTTDLCNASGKATATIAMIAAGLTSILFYFKQ